MTRIKNTTLCGHNIELTLTKISPKNASYYIDDDLLNAKLLDNIVKQMVAGKRNGTFKARSRISNENDIRSITARIEGQWRIRIDYQQLYRIFRWWYNHNFDPERIESLFHKAFGDRTSVFLLDKYNNEYNRNIFDFIGYLGDSWKQGNAFMDIIAQEIEEVEKRFYT